MKKSISVLLLIMVSVGAVVFAAPQISGNAGYIFRYSNGRIIQAIRDVNTSTLDFGTGLSAKIKFTLLESKALSQFFSMNCKSKAFLQSDMSSLNFNELYILYNSENICVKAGKFYVSWGTSPIDNPINLVESYNFSNIFSSPQRNPILGIQSTWWYDNGSSLELDAIPTFSPDIYPSLPATVESITSNFKNVQIGLRFSMMVGNYNVYLDAYHGFDHALDANNGDFYHYPVNAIGGEFSGPFLFNSNYNAYGEGMIALINGENSFVGVIGVNGFLLGGMMGLEVIRGLPGQSLLSPENAVVLYESKNINSTLAFESNFSLGFTDNKKYGSFVSGELKYQPVQNVSLSFGCNYATGEKGEYFEMQSKNNGFYLKGTVYF